ncbi:hypothetical protein TorRG33x02_068690, partial [Trema orientale]
FSPMLQFSKPNSMCAKAFLLQVSIPAWRNIVGSFAPLASRASAGPASDR